MKTILTETRSGKKGTLVLLDEPRGCCYDRYNGNPYWHTMKECEEITRRDKTGYAIWFGSGNDPDDSAKPQINFMFYDQETGILHHDFKDYEHMMAWYFGDPIVLIAKEEKNLVLNRCVCTRCSAARENEEEI